MPALHPKCQNRDHEWDHYPPKPGKSRCVRPGCQKVYGTRGKRKAQAQNPLQGKPATAPAPAKPAPAPAPAQTPPGRYQGIAARLAERKGYMPAMPAVEVESAHTPDETALDPSPADSEAAGEGEPEPKTFSLTDWLLPEFPDMAIAGAGWTVRRLGREPGEPDEEWKERWGESFDATVGGNVPRLEMPSWLALIVATIMLVLSMYLAGEKIEKAIPPKPVEPKAPESKCTDAQPTASPAASPESAPNSDESPSPTSTFPPLISDPPPPTSSAGPFGDAVAVANAA